MSSASQPQASATAGVPPQPVPCIGIDPRARNPPIDGDGGSKGKAKQQAPAPEASAPADQVPPQPFPCVGMDPRARVPYTPEHAAAAEEMRRARDAPAPPAGAVPPQPQPCIGIGPGARARNPSEQETNSSKGLSLADMVLLWVLT